MATEAIKAIWFECEHCKEGQYSDDYLDLDGEHQERAVRAGTIICENCGDINYVIEYV